MHEIVFGKYDTDGGGTVSVDEFRSMVYDMGHSLSEEELAIAITQLDSNGDGSIDLYVCGGLRTHPPTNPLTQTCTQPRATAFVPSFSPQPRRL